MRGLLLTRHRLQASAGYFLFSHTNIAHPDQLLANLAAFDDNAAAVWAFLQDNWGAALESQEASGSGPLPLMNSTSAYGLSAA